MPKKPRLTERPILFSGPMVRAIMGGRKTQTRRIIRVNPRDGAFYLLDGWPHRSLDGHGNRLAGMEEPYRCPYGQIGERLWVRETTARSTDLVRPYVYAADLHVSKFDIVGERWTPSIFMPRRACRIVLEITDIRVQRLQEITEEEARAEGATPTDPDLADFPPLLAFEGLWDHINGDRAPYESNPWVWALTFRVVA